MHQVLKDIKNNKVEYRPSGAVDRFIIDVPRDNRHTEIVVGQSKNGSYYNVIVNGQSIAYVEMSGSKMTTKQQNVANIVKECVLKSTYPFHNVRFMRMAQIISQIQKI